MGLTVEHVTSKSPVGVELGGDLDTVKATGYDSHYFHTHQSIQVSFRSSPCILLPLAILMQNHGY